MGKNEDYDEWGNYVIEMGYQDLAAGGIFGFELDDWIERRIPLVADKEGLNEERLRESVKEETEA